MIHEGKSTTLAEPQLRNEIIPAICLFIIISPHICWVTIDMQKLSAMRRRAKQAPESFDTLSRLSYDD